MEKFQLLREQALKHHRVAEHMVKVTYPLIQDTKLLVSITENLFLSLDNAISSILYHERLFKLVPQFPDNFKSKFQLLYQKQAKYNLPPEYFQIILELEEIIQLHRSSPIEFKRKDRFIICTEKYQTKAITFDQLKKYLVQTREFLDLMNQITSRNQRIFKNYQDE